jgi:hypothetical protein
VNFTALQYALKQIEYRFSFFKLDIGFIKEPAVLGYQLGLSLGKLIHIVEYGRAGY